MLPPAGLPICRSQIPTQDHVSLHTAGESLVTNFDFVHDIIYAENAPCVAFGSFSFGLVWDEAG
jgi:hypothetical protein